MPEEKAEAKVEVMKAAGRNLPHPSADILREFGYLGDCTCVNSRVRNLLQGALASHAVLRMRAVIRLEKQINEAEKRERWALRDDLKGAKGEEEEDLQAIRTLADRLAKIPRCDGG